MSADVVAVAASGCVCVAAGQSPIDNRALTSSPTATCDGQLKENNDNANINQLTHNTHKHLN